MNSLKFKIVTGVNEGYFHNNENKNTLKSMGFLWQSIAKKVYDETGIYVSAEIKQSITVYHIEWGCPIGGEDTYTIEGVLNPEFASISDWNSAVRLCARYLKDNLKQTTLTIEFNKCDVEYLKTVNILELIDKNELMAGDNIRFMYLGQYTKAVYVGINACKSMIHIDGDKDIWIDIDKISGFEKIPYYPEEKFSVLSKVNGIIFHPDIVSQLSITCGEISYMIKNIIHFVEEGNYINITFEKSRLFNRFAKEIRNPQTGIRKYNGGPQETVELFVGKNKYICKFNEYSEDIVDDKTILNIEFIITNKK